MSFGELCYLDKNPELDLEAVVLQAASDYQRKYGERPNLCLVHPSLLEEGARRLGSLQLEPKTTVLPNYVWIGMGDVEVNDSMPVAR